MNDEMTPVGDTEIRIAIEIGDNAQTTQRVKDAITELADALAEADADDVAGFALQSLKAGAFLFDSRTGGPVVRFDATAGGKQEPYLKLRDVGHRNWP